MTLRRFASTRAVTHASADRARRRVTSLCVVSVQAALTYAEAQMKIDDAGMNDEVTIGLRQLNNLAKILKRRRQENGFVHR